MTFYLKNFVFLFDYIDVAITAKVILIIIYRHIVTVSVIIIITNANNSNITEGTITIYDFNDKIKYCTVKIEKEI